MTPDSLFWPVMPYEMVALKLDMNQQPHVIQQYQVPFPQNDQYQLHDRALYSIWMHFVDSCVANSASDPYTNPVVCDSELHCFSAPDILMNIHTNMERLPIFMLLSRSNGKPLSNAELNNCKETLHTSGITSIGTLKRSSSIDSIELGSGSTDEMSMSTSHTPILMCGGKGQLKLDMTRDTYTYTDSYPHKGVMDEIATNDPYSPDRTTLCSTPYSYVTATECESRNTTPTKNLFNNVVVIENMRNRGSPVSTLLYEIEDLPQICYKSNSSLLQYQCDMELDCYHEKNVPRTRHGSLDTLESSFSMLTMLDQACNENSSNENYIYLAKNQSLSPTTVALSPFSPQNKAITNSLNCFPVMDDMIKSQPQQYGNDTMSSYTFFHGHFFPTTKNGLGEAINGSLF